MTSARSFLLSVGEAFSKQASLQPCFEIPLVNGLDGFNRLSSKPTLSLSPMAIELPR
jgi:hypothetical protein